mmetsp:Transcript_7281/g.15903  ORF Transcript_7281/g.15903 Transcript_7281/m.15903 type:complete len:370 (-) Transcript_7281:792-1901(-)|eukprot:CAMPEP_0202902146 /NCGR_PEP_ID=MMETSP1392-20130828/16582_1 /ASSEMBLY_ACC=CAM_ASM_000868 /TAXON_ID=225041 /ORGANISM="Chlamydomonas chlamydogama, Strain SAG 11-48b" /LENGTH=369 /DNA_ID=CAMNT_0049588867 /DNA_START=180 /DNA_END=1289 /DNA_ORIENTATION=+
MGAYLSSPITEKEVWEGHSEHVKFGGSAMQGWRRTMEDAHLAEVTLGQDPKVAMFGVFDGHGGSEVAKFCQKYMATEIQKLKEFNDGSVEDSLVRVFHRMDEMLRDNTYSQELEQFKTKETNEEEDAADENDGVGTMDALDLLKRVFQLKRFMGDNTNGSGEGSSGNSGFKVDDATEQEDNVVQAGCTAVVALVKNNHLYVANAGDSRGVLCRGGKAVALSEDHKPAQETERTRIIAAGGFLSDIGGVCRVNGNLNLSRAIGDLRYKNNTDLAPAGQIITAEPDIRKLPLTPEDKFFVLACDGVWDVMSNQDVVDFVSQRLEKGMSPKEAASELLDACLANDPKEARGVGCDNMTAVVVQFVSNPAAAQ